MSCSRALNPRKTITCSLLGCALLLSPVVMADLLKPSVSGHLKYQIQSIHYPSHSIYRDVYGSSSTDHLVDGRVKLAAREGAVDLQVDYQVQTLHGDRLRSHQLYNDLAMVQAYPEDDRRILDLSKVVSEHSDTVLLHRLDRFNFTYSNENTVVRIGRQVLSWGNGLIFNPVDFFNPFDPVALDTEYKMGDDMLYGQYLLPQGDDLQAVVVGRRDARGAISARNSSKVVKYHAWVDNWLHHWVKAPTLLAGAEVDFLLGQHYDDEIVAAGLVSNVGGAVWRTDLMWTRTEHDMVFSAVANISYSSTWAGNNVSLLAEYFYNGFGLESDDYSLDAIYADEDLPARLRRGELYTIGRHYLGLAATVELTPLWLATPTLLLNLDDQSALLQLGSRYDLAQNWHFIGALNLPLGSKSTEYGGLRIGSGSTNTIATDGGFYAQLAFYW